MSSVTGGDSQIDRELEILTSDYEATREDDRQSLAREIAVLSAGVAVFAAFYALVATAPQLLEHYPLLAATLPLAPYLIAQAEIVHTVESVLRGYYMRSLEHAIHQRVAIPSALGSTITFPAIGHLTALLHSSRFASPLMRTTYFFGWLSVVGLFGGSSIIAISVIPNLVDRIAASLVYLGLAAFLLWFWFEAVRKRNRKFYLSLYSRYPEIHRERLDATIPRFPDRARAPGGWAYLILPRVSDLIKIPIFLIAWVISLVSVSISLGFDSDRILYSAGLACMYLVVFEYLVYQARYQWNDLRGIRQDEDHVSATARQRLPKGWTRLSVVALIVRILIALYVIDLVFRGTQLLAPAYALALVPFIIAVPYELARYISDRRMPNLSHIRLVHWLIYLLVGVGFGIRVAMGVLVGSFVSLGDGGGYLQVGSTQLVLLLITFSLVGSASIVAILAIEAAVTSAKRGEYFMRPHVAPLLRYIRPILPTGNVDIERYPILRSRDAVRSPWFVFHLLAVTLASIISLYIGGILGANTGFMPNLQWVYLLCWTTTAYLIKFWPAWLGGCFVVVLTGGWMASIGTNIDWKPAIAVFIVTAAMLSNTWDRLGAQTDFVLGARKIVHMIQNSYPKVCSSVLKFVFGEAAVARLRREGHSGGDFGDF